MKTFKQLREKGRCWTGYKPVPGKEPYSPGSCKKEEVIWEAKKETNIKAELQELSARLAEISRKLND